MTYYSFVKLILITSLYSLSFSIILLISPLTNVPSYESAMASSIFSLLFFIYAFYKIQKERFPIDYQELILSISLILFTIPLTLLIISGLINGFCPSSNGFLFYFLLNAPNLFLLSAIGLIYHKIEVKPLVAAISYFLIIFVSLLFNIYTILKEPMVKFYSIFWGYFPGPIYDEDIDIERTLILHKIFSIIISLSIWLLFYKRDFKRVLIFLLILIPAYITIKEIQHSEPSRERIIKRLGAIYRSEHFEIIYPPDQEWSQYIDIIGKLHEFYYQSLKNDLKTDFKVRIRSYIFRDEEEKKELTGAGRTQIAKPWLKEIYLTPVSITDSKLKHEIAHILIGEVSNSPLGLYGRFKGLLPNMAVVEGLCVALEPETGILNLHEKALALMKRHKLPSFRELFNARKFYSISGAISYSTSGSFIRFLIDKFGIERFLRVLRGEDFESVYNTTFYNIEQDYLKFLDSIILSPQKEYYSSIIYNSKGLLEKRCPHDIAMIKRQVINYNRKYISTLAYQAGEELVESCSQDSDIIIEMARSLIYQQRYKEAENLILSNLNKAENLYYKSLMIDILTDIYIFADEKRKAAELIFNHLPLLPDSDARRNFELKSYLFEKNKIDLIKGFYSIKRAPLSKAGILSFYMNNYSEPAAYYLYGRLLFNMLDYENCQIYLKEFIFSEYNNIPFSLIIESANMLLIAAIFTRNYELADSVSNIFDLRAQKMSEAYDYHYRKYIHLKKFIDYLKEIK